MFSLSPLGGEVGVLHFQRACLEVMMRNGPVLTSVDVVLLVVLC